MVVEARATLSDTLIEDDIEVLQSPGGLWAVVDRAPRDVGSGCRAILDGWFQRRPDFAPKGDPHLERHRATSRHDFVVSMCARKRPSSDESAWNMAMVSPDGSEATRP